MELTYIYLAAVIGAIVYALIDYIGAVGTNVLTKRYLLITVVNIVAGMALIWAIELKPNVYMLGTFDGARLMAMMFGISGQKLFKSIIDVMDRRVKTTIGLNDENK